ncbi:KptA family-domain-containing protein [Cristinia sonorae]|uniref:2'-phosphotransferase n=1 Tax=Cristinia sonorae TaxID=1940300 RepID=A0A8K0XSU6_9AGAR|nr:KptA family-domain-containing protein [Cristinia sonorae]
MDYADREDAILGGKGGGKKKYGKQSNPKPSGSGGNKKGQGNPKLRGIPGESEDKRMSKTLSWVLRHGSQSEKLFMRPDGFVRVQDILERPRFSDFNMAVIEQIVANDSKDRFKLVCETDSTSGEFVWWIRANQGHSIKSVVDLEVTPISSASDIPTGTAVHGTSLQAWESIKTQGLSKMKRNHIHLAQGTGVISGMRNASQVFVYVNVNSAIASGVKFGLSSNGVVLSEGNDNGFIPPSFFEKVVTRQGAILLDRSSTAVDELQSKTEAIAL